jgi:hypothetical protein
MATKELILGTVDDMVADFLYYDRKEDEDLPRGAIEAAVESGEVTADEIAAKFRSGLFAGLGLAAEG